MFIIVIPNLNIFKLKIFLKKMPKNLAAVVETSEEGEKKFSKKFIEELDAIRGNKGRILYQKTVTEIVSRSFGSEIFPEEIAEFAHQILERRGYALLRNGVDYENKSFGWQTRTRYGGGKEIFSF